MKKKFLLLALLIPFIFAGCQNFSIKEMRSTYLILDGTNVEKVAVFCKSDNLGIPSSKECKKVTDEETLNWIKGKKLISSENIQVFDVPSRSQIQESKDIEIEITADVDDKTYSGVLEIKTLVNSESLQAKSVELEAKDGTKIKCFFTYTFYVAM